MLWMHDVRIGRLSMTHTVDAMDDCYQLKHIVQPMRSAMWGFVLSLDPEILRSAAVNNDKITLHMMNLIRGKLYVKETKM